MCLGAAPRTVAGAGVARHVNLVPAHGQRRGRRELQLHEARLKVVRRQVDVDVIAIAERPIRIGEQADIQAGLDELDRGEAVSMEDAFAEARELIAARRKQ